MVSFNCHGFIVRALLLAPVVFSLLPEHAAASEVAPNNLTSTKIISHKCNLFNGHWTAVDSGPLYTHSSCPFLDPEFDCLTYGRPDREYLRYAWQPHSCKLPSFNGVDLLKRWRGKKIMFVGDSLSLNQWESLACMIHAAVPNSKISFVRHASVTFESGLSNFVPGRVIADASHRKRVKYEARCQAIEYGFLPFSFSSLGELDKEVVALLKRVQNFSKTQDIGARAAAHIFSRIGFAIARGVGAQIVSRLPTNFL